MEVKKLFHFLKKGGKNMEVYPVTLSIQACPKVITDYIQNIQTTQNFYHEVLNCSENFCDMGFSVPFFDTHLPQQ